MTLESISKKPLWKYFLSLNAIPRASKKEEEVIRWIISIAKDHNLKYTIDEAGNIAVYKPATSKTHSTPVALQSHVDMVHQKNNDTVFDFDTQGIEMYIEDGWLKAKGTTLGADNGLGAAAMLAILTSTDVAHGPLQCVFTVDEEAGMSGAKGISSSLVDAPYLINLDSEDEGEVFVGCAGGIDTFIEGTLTEKEVEGTVVTCTLNGLTGGHSGLNIIDQRANANQILLSILREHWEKNPFYISSYTGGGLRNAIPREASITLVLPSPAQQISEIKASAKRWSRLFLKTDPHWTFEVANQGEQTVSALNEESTYTFLNIFCAFPNGVLTMSNALPGLVESSSNLANIDLRDGKLMSTCLQRFNSEEAKQWMLQKTRAVVAQTDWEIRHDNEYPSWAPNMDSKLLTMVVSAHEKSFGFTPKIQAIHAGLECGLLGKAFPNTQMVSIGPTIRGAHSPTERADIASGDRFWDFFCTTLHAIV